MNKAPKQLIVEGPDDRASVAHLMGWFIHWPVDNYPVSIEVAGGKDKILKSPFLQTTLKSEPVQVLGVIVDADFTDDISDETSVERRYKQIRKLCSGVFPNLPIELPKEGLIIDNAEGKLLGVWIMPDNISDGSLETFLRFLVPEAEEQIWTHAQASTASAKALGAAYHDVHKPKADLHTYLAWQNPPGNNYGIALSKSVLNPNSPYAAALVQWFRSLYDL